jgi:parallel beta-helix repeat protein
VWQASDSPIGVIAPVQVVSNATLTIQPGVQVLFYGNYAFQVDGTLQVLGSSNQPVTFTSAKSAPQRGDWPGLVFTANSSNNPCVLSNAVVQYAQVGVNCTATSPQIVNSTIQYCSQQGISLTRSSPLIQGCTIQQNSAQGIYAYDTSSPQIFGNQVVSNSSYGIYLYGTTVSNHNCLPVIQGNTINGNVSYALYSYYYYQPGQVVVDARSNWWGTADASVIAGLVYDYNDNPTYSPLVNFGNWLGSQGGIAAPGTAVSGSILSNTVWQAINSPIQVIGNVQVLSNATLTIQPGVQVLFNGYYQLQVNGGLQALGGAANRVLFTNAKNVPQISVLLELPGDFSLDGLRGPERRQRSL